MKYIHAKDGNPRNLVVSNLEIRESLMIDKNAVTCAVMALDFITKAPWIDSHTKAMAKHAHDSLEAAAYGKSGLPLPTAEIHPEGDRWVMEFRSAGGWGTAYYYGETARDEAERAAREYLALHAADGSPESDTEEARR